MRVISGSARGTRLGAVPKGVRPVSDRAREGLFSSLEAGRFEEYLSVSLARWGGSF